jgi:hypothetical protein
VTAAVPEGAHEWVSFDDPSEARTWLLDVTFLESSWRCIYGRGCQGVLTEPAAELAEGCCSYGAHFTGDEDALRVERAAETLTDEQWQFRSVAQRRGGPLRRGKGQPVTTRLVEGACIFLNRPSHPSGAGCALHRAALDGGLPPLALKPDVCWQLPLRRDETVAPDGHVTTVIGEWRRQHWGRGGADFAWWCTEAPEAFSARRPVYRTMREELVMMAGRDVYALICAYLEARQETAGGKWARTKEPASARRQAGGHAVRVPHPTVRHATP